MQVVEVLEHALQRLENEGWCKGAYTNEDGLCTVRALWTTINEELSWANGGRILMTQSIHALAEQTGMSNLALWNDHQDRTFGQVKEVFRRAIAEQSVEAMV